jgi:hypothetical protein
MELDIGVWGWKCDCLFVIVGLQFHNSMYSPHTVVFTNTGYPFNLEEQIDISYFFDTTLKILYYSSPVLPVSSRPEFL